MWAGTGPHCTVCACVKFASRMRTCLTLACMAFESRVLSAIPSAALFLSSTLSIFLLCFLYSRRWRFPVLPIKILASQAVKPQLVLLQSRKTSVIPNSSYITATTSACRIDMSKMNIPSHSSHTGNSGPSKYSKLYSCTVSSSVASLAIV